MGSSNFQVFNEGFANVETDAEYLAETQRINGLVSGIAKTRMHNKLFRQTSVMTAALAQFMANAGQTVSDNDLAALVSVIQGSIETPVGSQAKANVVQANLNEHLADYMPHQSGLNEYGSAIDANGLYTIISYKRADGTLYMKSTLSNPDASLNYQTDTWQFYNAAGTTIMLTKTWTISYDANGGIVSKVVA